MHISNMVVTWSHFLLQRTLYIYISLVGIWPQGLSAEKFAGSQNHSQGQHHP